MSVLSGVCVVVAAAAPLLALAQAYPVKPVRVILASPAGGTPDVVARMVAPGLSSRLGQQFIIDNRGGAGGLIATELTAKAHPDGYTLFIGGPGSLTIIPHLRQNMPYDTLRDLAPVSLIAVGPYLLITHPSVPVKTVKDLIALAKAEPGKLNYASAGNGAANHLAMELFKSLAGVNITHVPYKGAPLAVTDLLAGNANLMLNSIPPVLNHIKAGRLRLLGVSSVKRASQLPDVPTLNEAGVPGYEFITWFAMLAPARTPPAIVARLNDTVAQVVRALELRAQLENLGYELGGGSPQEFAAYLRAEMEKYGKIVKASGAKVD
jgi:tripartite-type tricarboxylate transporter receptor subunit TctC